jgi:hypothetical protein
MNQFKPVSLEEAFRLQKEANEKLEQAIAESRKQHFAELFGNKPSMEEINTLELPFVIPDGIWWEDACLWYIEKLASNVMASSSMNQPRINALKEIMQIAHNALQIQLRWDEMRKEIASLKAKDDDKD